MKKAKLFVFIIILMSTFILFGCQSFKKKIYDFQSDFGGLNRRITLYSGGEVVKVYEGKIYIDGGDNTNRGGLYFLLNDVPYIINGTYTIEVIK